MSQPHDVQKRCPQRVALLSLGASRQSGQLKRTPDAGARLPSVPLEFEDVAAMDIGSPQAGGVSIGRSGERASDARVGARAKP